MVRVFALDPGKPPEVKPHIVAEGVGWVLPGGALDASIMNGGLRTLYCTLEELLASKDGRGALRAWRA